MYNLQMVNGGTKTQKTKYKTIRLSTYEDNAPITPRRKYHGGADRRGAIPRSADHSLLPNMDSRGSQTKTK